MINNREQSEMLGPFMWGKRPHTELTGFVNNENTVKIAAICKGTAGIHNRTIVFDKYRELIINDDIGIDEGTSLFHINPLLQVKKENERIIITLPNNNLVILNSNNSLVKIEESICSDAYNSLQKNKCISLSFSHNNKVAIHFELN